MIMGYSRVVKYANYLKGEDFVLSDFEALKVAAMIDQNENYETAHVLIDPNKYPSALEKIGIELEDIKKAMEDA